MKWTTLVYFEHRWHKFKLSASSVRAKWVKMAIIFTGYSWLWLLITSTSEIKFSFQRICFSVWSVEVSQSDGLLPSLCKKYLDNPFHNPLLSQTVPLLSFRLNSQSRICSFEAKIIIMNILLKLFILIVFHKHKFPPSP